MPQQAQNLPELVVRMGVVLLHLQRTNARKTPKDEQPSISVADRIKALSSGLACAIAVLQQGADSVTRANGRPPRRRVRCGATAGYAARPRRRVDCIRRGRSQCVHRLEQMEVSRIGGPRRNAVVLEARAPVLGPIGKFALPMQKIRQVGLLVAELLTDFCEMVRVSARIGCAPPRSGPFDVELPVMARSSTAIVNDRKLPGW